MAVYRGLSDDQLSELLKTGDKGAYTEIYNRYNSLLYIHAYKKFQNREEARDVVQEVFTMIWQRRETLNSVSNLGGFLYSCVHNSILNFISRENIKAKYIDSLQSFINTAPEHTDSLIREKQLRAIIEKEIASLPLKMRIVFEMSRNEKLSHREIAEKLNISEETVKRQVKNALKILRTRLGLILYLIFYLFYR
ncbi:RNA polymerase sigma-70 factor [Desertivirga brevis]|uniref:RNA polymerase sigma-70 factor n=1 Tax=Desertivirga brevis TaxID=2810310 RepID=UPI001A966468|nr:RNA polymerase sigma-70 factor [Pedobacter sp. SYSU D00873]